jgi:hypothetical protein
VATYERLLRASLMAFAAVTLAFSLAWYLTIT